MKTLLLVAVSFLAFASHSAHAQVKTETTAATPAGTGAQFKFKDGDTFDFGEVKLGPDAVHEFSFTNIGDQPLLIVDAKPSCSCTTPEWPREQIMPGATGVIRVGYQTKKPGPFFKEVFIQSNAFIPSGDRRYTIYIKGTVQDTASGK